MSSTLNEVVKISDTGFIDSINSLDLRVDNNTKLFINSSGNVGIGTTDPLHKLHVEGDIHIPSGSNFKIGDINFQEKSHTINLTRESIEINLANCNEKTVLSLTSPWIQGITWNSDRQEFIAVGTHNWSVDGTGVIVKSTDGLNWQSIGSLPKNNDWYSVCWSSELSLYVVVGDAIDDSGFLCMTSSDGITWTGRSTPENNWYISVCWSSELSLFVAVSYDGTNRVMTSSDGTSWTAQSCPLSPWNKVIWVSELSLFVAVGGYNDTVIMTSSNGTSWTSRSLPGNSSTWYSVTYSKKLGKLVAIGTGLSASSSDGITWSLSSTIAGSNPFKDIIWIDLLECFVAVAQTGANRLAYSYNGTDWNKVSLDSKSHRAIAWSQELSRFITVVDNGDGNSMFLSPIFAPNVKNTLLCPPSSINCNQITGNIGIGTTNPSTLLHIKQANDDDGGDLNDINRSAIIIERAGASNSWSMAIENSAEALAFYYGTTPSTATAVKGYISIGTTNQMNFTGQHRCFVKGYNENELARLYGLIVCSDNNNYIGMSNGLVKGKAAITINECLPIVSLSQQQQDKSVFGVISDVEGENRVDTYGAFYTPFQKEKGDTRAYINSVGEGGIWVCNQNGNLESGDYIVTSNIPGYGMKQETEFLANYTVAKITMDCDFTNPRKKQTKFKKDHLDNLGNIIWEESDEYENSYEVRYLKADGTQISEEEYIKTQTSNKQENIYIAAFVGCTYHCG